MDNRNQAENKIKILANIQHSITKDDYILQVEDCYLGYVELTVYYKQLHEEEISPIAEGILALLVEESPQNIQQISDLFYVDLSVINDAIQELQYLRKIKVVEGNQIVTNEETHPPILETYSRSIVINPQTLKIVDVEPFYHIPTERILPSNTEITDQDVSKLFSCLTEEQIEQWTYKQVAGPHMFQVTLYDHRQKLQRKVLFDEDGHEIYEMEKKQVELSHLLLPQRQPDAMIEKDEVATYLNTDSSWIFAMKSNIPIEIKTYIQSASTSTLLIISQFITNEEKRAIYIMETRSKGILTVFEVMHDYDLLFLSRKNVLQSTSYNQYALITDELYIQVNYLQIQSIIVNLAKESIGEQSLKAFIYLVEQQTEVDVLRSIIEELAKSASSNDLMHRGRILDNYALYKTLAKEAYELGIQAHAQEVKL